MDDTAWPPPEGVCPMPACNGVITALALELDPRGEGECGRCGNFFVVRGSQWVHVDQAPDKPGARG